MNDFVERLAACASEQGLLDVAYATVDTPIGDVGVAATDRGRVRLALPGESLDHRSPAANSGT